ncbi:MAG: CapA family protein [Lachnospiraceae bacterium]|nr:CapA family protein [Lachnospiraceae bacterium]
MEKIIKNENIKMLGAVLSIILIIIILRIIKVNITDDSITQTNNHNTSPAENIITNTDGSVSVTIMGNVLVSEKMRSSYRLYGTEGFMSKEIASTIKDSDIAIMNQTFCLSGSNELNYSASTNDLDMLQDMGINMVSLANKYFRISGADSSGSIATTLKDNNINSSGAGRDLNDACSAAYLTYNDKTIGLLSVMKISGDNNEGIAVNSNGHVRSISGIYGENSTDEICDSIKKAKKNCDFLIVNISWEDDSKKITKSMKSDAHSFIKSGADIIAGCSDKSLDVEYYKNKPIIYGTGNFLNTGNPSDTKLYKAVISKNNKCKLTIHDCKTAAYFVEKKTSS